MSRSSQFPADLELDPVVSIPLAIVVVWLFTSYMVSRFPTLTNKRILLLIAHPDDEAMFFAPSVRSLIRPRLGNQLKILCLSSGNADGLGEVRKKELLKSATILGLESSDVVIVEDANLQDGPTPWNPQYIARILLSNLAPALPNTPASKPLTTLVDAIITFDNTGVSQHPNHVSCYQGVQAFLSDLMRGRDGWESPVAVYALRSVNVLRKYSNIGDSLPTLIAGVIRIARQNLAKPITKMRARDARAGGKGLVGGSNPPSLLFISGPWSWNKAQRAMVSGHWSQMIWFRWGWIGMGRYLLINDLDKVKAL